MTRRRRSSSIATASKLAELSIAAPQVVAHRVARMAMNGPFYSKRDQAEFIGMVQEKQVAFARSWLAMAAEAAKVQQALWLRWATGFTPLAWPAATRPAAAHEMAASVLRIAGKGLSPVHAKAVSNAKRLARRRPR